MLKHIREFLQRDDGPTAVEYAVLLALIVVVCVGSAMSMADATAESFDESSDSIASALGS
jgi:pilus assembly protein Flp/PilA